MPPKRKRVMEDFDPNASDPDDDNFDPSQAGPRKSSKRSQSGRSAKGGSRKKRRGYRGSDIDEDEDDLLSDEDEGSFLDQSEEDDDAPLNAAGRKARKAAVTAQNYAESEEGEDDDDEISEKSEPEEKQEQEQEQEQEQAQQRPRSQRIVKLKVGNKPALAQSTRRATRAQSRDVDDEDFVELSTSGRHAVRSAASKSKSPETFARRPSRAAKGLIKTPAPIEEVSHEDASHLMDDAEAPDELAADWLPTQKGDGADDEMAEVPATEELVGNVDEEEQGGDGNAEEGEDAEKATENAGEDPAADDDEDDEDDIPITRRTRASRTSISVPKEDPGDDAGAGRRSRRLTRRSGKGKSMQEPSSDFEPGEESDEEPMSDSNKRSRREVNDDTGSPTPARGRGRPRGRSGRSSRQDSGDEEPDLDADELVEEARELRQTSRPRRRPRAVSPIVYQENTRRSRAKVNYYMPPLNSVNIEEEEAPEPAATPARGRGRRAGTSVLWERNLNTTFGPFGGGGGAGSLLSGPWGTGAAGGVDSDSSDDEMVHRSNFAGNVGVTPTSGAPPGGGLVSGGTGLGMEAVGATPNVGKLKDRKALADADPLGVDMNVDFNQVGGLQGHIDQLKEMVQLPLLYPELFSRFHVTPPRGVLFHGPPGTGKTLLARALANSVGSGGRKISFYMRKGADALSKWVGEAEKQLRLLFEEARKTQPSIIFFDEIDGLAPVRSSKQEQIHASIVSTLLALMDGMDGRGQVIVIGATNRPDNIDPALRRPGRFDREFYFPLPDIEGRRSILNIHTKDWGMSEQFKTSLAENTKGYGGADLRALCTEAALNAIQRTYPQIYSTQQKLIVDPAKINVHASDFMISIKKLIPSSERSATTGAQPLAESIRPLLRNQLDDAKRHLDAILPRKKKITALEEAMFEQTDDRDHGFARERLAQDFERSRVFRPRFIIHGVQGMGQGYLASAVLHHFEGVHVQNFDLPALLGDGRAMDQVIVGLFAEVRRHKPSVIYIPNIDAWYEMLQGSLALTTFKTMLRSIPPTDPVLLLATAECEPNDLASALYRDLFGFSRKNRMEIKSPSKENREEYFSKTLQNIKLKPGEFPDLENRKRRVLEELPVAPTEAPKPPTKAEVKALKKRDYQCLNQLKILLQPIMDQINRKYKKFRQPAIAQNLIDHLFAESDPNFVVADVAEGQNRPFEIVKDKLGHDVLKETATGKIYYNLETTTIEERLSNGFYARPKDFLFDIKTLAKDAKNSGDRERTLKANELVSNVEVDVATIEASQAQIDWEAIRKRQEERHKAKDEKARKRQAMSSVIDRVQSDLGGNDSDSQGPVVLGERVPPGHHLARFQVRSPLSNGHGQSGHESTSLSNGTSYAADKGDLTMADADDTQGVSQLSVMGPPSHKGAGPTQISQKSAVTSLPAGVSPSAVINEASTTKTSDPSTGRSWNTELTNGNHEEQQNSGSNDHTGGIPDTFPQETSQLTFSDDPWPHSQVHAAHRGNIPPPEDSQPSSHSNNTSQPPPAPKNTLNEPGKDISYEEQSSVRHSGSSSSQPMPIDAQLEGLLNDVVDGTRGCTIEQLEQVNREMMDTIWRTRGEWNRIKVLLTVTNVFNDTIQDLETMQGMGDLSQQRPDED